MEDHPIFDATDNPTQLEMGQISNPVNVANPNHQNRGTNVSNNTLPNTINLSYK